MVTQPTDSTGPVMATPPITGSATPDVVTEPRRVVPVREARELPPPLTVASEEWVGASQEPASPWVPSEFLHNAYREKDRMLADAYVEENGEAPFVPPSRPVEPPPLPVSQPVVVAEPPVAAPRARRASLAESRRRGIGVTRPTPEATQDEPEDPPDPEPPPTPPPGPAPTAPPPVDIVEPPPVSPEQRPVHQITGTVLVPDPVTVQLAPVDAAPPHAVALPLRRALGVDVSAIPVRRGEAVAETARRLNARAFTTDGIVHLPDHAGALDSHDVAPLLAHELTHAVQQQRFGAALPSPGSALATRLEDDAVAVEGWVGGGAVGAPPPMVRQLAPRQDDEDWRLPIVDSSALIDEFERVTGDPVTIDAEDHELPDVSAHGLLAAFHDLRLLADDDTDDTDDPGGGAVAGTGPGKSGKAGLSVDQLVDLIADNPPRRWLDLDDQDNFEEIANRLYNHLLGRLRFDVLVERERSGTLMDFS